MINAVLTALPTYSLSFFTLPCWVKMEIDYLRRKFLWSGTQKDGKAFCLVNWKRVCKRKEFGGLGIINLRDFNKALLLKWWWKLFDDSKRIWTMLVSQSYRPSSGWWSEQCINRASSFWKGMASIKDIFSRDWKGGQRWEKHEGLVRQVVFSSSLGDAFLERFLSSQRPRGTNTFSLDGKWLEPSIVQLNSSTSLGALGGVFPTPTEKSHPMECSRDWTVWERDAKSCFSVKNTYFMLNDGSLRCPFANIVWHIKLPLKIKAFLWLVINGLFLHGIISWKETGKGLIYVLFAQIMVNPSTTCSQLVLILFKSGGCWHNV